MLHDCLAAGLHLYTAYQRHEAGVVISGVPVEKSSVKKCEAITRNAHCEHFRRRRILGILLLVQRVLLTSGLSLLAIYGVIRFEGCLGSRAALNSFETLESPAPAANESPVAVSSSLEADFTKWGQNRDRAYKRGLSNQFSAPLAVLQIPGIRLRVPVLEGIDELTLNHAVGRIPGTAHPGGQGNLGIAGHRDGFFRGLKDVKVGDVIDLKTMQGTDTYVVDQIQIVKPDNVGVLKSRSIPSLTLVTCYPFYFVGRAPKRFVITANLMQHQPAASVTSGARLSSQTRSTTQEEQ
jgi:sortase A